MSNERNDNKFEDGDFARHRLTNDKLLVLHHSRAGEYGGFDHEMVLCRTSNYSKEYFRPYELVRIGE